VRENCGGAYFGEKIEEDNYAMDPWKYERSEVERVARIAGELARLEGKEKGEERRKVVSLNGFPFVGLSCE